MFDFKPAIDADKSTAWADLHAAALAITAGEGDAIANMANVAALCWEMLPGLNWAGFYRVKDGALVLGPFQGRPACIRIAIGAGVCGAAVASGAVQCVADVHAFPGHIACDAVSASELVVPVIVDGRVIAVLDLDSPTPGRFDETDAAAGERLCAEIAHRLASA